MKVKYTINGMSWMLLIVRDSSHSCNFDISFRNSHISWIVLLMWDQGKFSVPRAYHLSSLNNHTAIKQGSILSTYQDYHRCIFSANTSVTFQKSHAHCHLKILGVSHE